MRLSQNRAFLSSIHANGKVETHDFNHDYQHHAINYIPAIVLINRKKYQKII